VFVCLCAGLLFNCVFGFSLKLFWFCSVCVFLCWCWSCIICNFALFLSCCVCVFVRWSFVLFCVWLYFNCVFDFSLIVLCFCLVVFVCLCAGLLFYCVFALQCVAVCCSALQCVAVFVLWSLVSLCVRLFV